MSSTEAPFRATMPVDINGHRILLTAGGDTVFELVLRWAEIAENFQELHGSWTLISGAVAAQPLTQASQAQPMPPVQPANSGAWNAAAPPPAAFQAAATPVCAHGPRNAVSKVGAKGPWKAWMCNAPQGGAKCEPIWVKQNTPEWNTFPG
jgi:hypothetical protein